MAGTGRLFVIADDFTGALDTGVQFARGGTDVLVTLYDEGNADPDALFDGGADGLDVLVVDAETRHMEPARAAERVKRLTSAAARRGFTGFYKKTDSALRGNIGAELAALLEGCGERSLAFAPAFPKSRRVTRGGVHYVDGVPLAASVFASDPFEPARESAVARVIAAQTAIRTVAVPVEDYRDGAPTDAENRSPGCEIPRERNNSRDPDDSNALKIEIYDAGTDGDLRRLVRFLAARGKLRALAGCAGLASALSEVMYDAGEARGVTSAEPVSTSEPAAAETPALTPDGDGTRGLLLVTGSVNPVTFGQLARAEDAGFHVITLTPEQKLHMDTSSATPHTPTTADIHNDAPEADAAFTAIADAAAAVLTGNGRVVLRAAGDAADVAATDAFARGRGIAPDEVGRRISFNLARLCGLILGRCQIGTLAVFGGDTLFDIMRAARISAIAPIREISPGIVAARVLSGRRRFALVTKSGGLGGPDALAEIKHYHINIRFQ